MRLFVGSRIPYQRQWQDVTQGAFERVKVALRIFVTQLGRQILCRQWESLPQRTSTVRLLIPLPSQSQFSQPLVARDLVLSVREDGKQSDYRV